MKPTCLLLIGSFICVGALYSTASAQALRNGVRPYGARPNGTVTRTGSYDSSRYGNGTFTQSVTRSPGSAQRSLSWTNANGGTGSHTATNTWNSTAGTGTHQASTTYANDKTSSSQGAWAKTGTGDYSYSGTHTGVNGQVTDVSRTVTNSDGTKTVDSTYTNAATGKSSTVDKSITDASGSKQVDTTATGPNGKSVTSDQTYTKTDNGWTKTGTITGPNGGVGTDSRAVSYTHNSNGTITRTSDGSVTGPNGNTHQSDNTETYTKTYTPGTTD
jgi:hypothetical protein